MQRKVNSTATKAIYSPNVAWPVAVKYQNSSMPANAAHSMAMQTIRKMVVRDERDSPKQDNFGSNVPINFSCISPIGGSTGTPDNQILIIPTVL